VKQTRCRVRQPAGLGQFEMRSHPSSGSCWTERRSADPFYRLATRWGVFTHACSPPAIPTRSPALCCWTRPIRQFDRIPGEREQFENFRSFQRTFSPMARIGIWRAYLDSGGSFDFGGLPDADRARMKAIWSSPALFQSQRRELDAVPEIHRQVRPLGSLGSLPLMVISAGEQPQDWLELQSEMTSLSTNSVHRTIDNATHLSLVLDEQVAGRVSEAVLEVVEAARSSSGHRAQKSPPGSQFPGGDVLLLLLYAASIASASFGSRAIARTSSILFAR